MANAITFIRILCGAALVFCTAFSPRFYLIYIIGGISDVLDGFAARRLKTESDFGARLDTMADTVFVIVVLIKVLNAVNVPLWLIIWVIGIAVIKCINIISGIVISGRFISEHTVMNKVSGVLLFMILFCIGRFPWLPAAALAVLTCSAATFAAIQEGYIVHAGKEVNSNYRNI